MTQNPDDRISIQVTGVDKWQPPEGQSGRGMKLRTTRGDIEAIIHHDAETKMAIVWVWGARGGFDGPGDGLFGVLSEELKDRVTSLRVNYRQPGVMIESVMDTLSGVSFLSGTGHTDIVLVGHSFGGAVVISAAPFSPLVKAVVALSSQTAGASGADKVSPKPLLLAHGQEDTRLPPHCSQQIYDWAKEPKELVLFPGAEHGLRECKDELHDLVRDWILNKLGIS